MRGPTVNTGPLFRAIKQFPCTHEIMFLLFSIVATGAKPGENPHAADRGRNEDRGNGNADKIVPCLMRNDSLPSLIDHRSFYDLIIRSLVPNFLLSYSILLGLIKFANIKRKYMHLAIVSSKTQ